MGNHDPRRFLVHYPGHRPDVSWRRHQRTRLPGPKSIVDENTPAVPLAHFCPNRREALDKGDPPVLHEPCFVVGARATEPCPLVIHHHHVRSRVINGTDEIIENPAHQEADNEYAVWLPGAVHDRCCYPQYELPGQFDLSVFHIQIDPGDVDIPRAEALGSDKVIAIRFGL